MIRPADGIELSAQIAELARAGVPLGAGLRALAEEEPRRRLARTYRQIAEKLDSGVDLEDALAGPTVRLPAAIRGLLTAAIRSGDLPKSLAALLVSERRSVEITRQFWGAFLYPIIVFSLLIGWMLFYAHYVILPMEAVYNDFGTKLPWITYFVLAVGHLIPWIAVGFLACILCLWVARELIIIYGGWDLLTLIPIVGKLIRYRSMVQFSGLLALLLRQQIPLAEALYLTSESLSNRSLAGGVRQAAGRVAGGSTLSDAVAADPLFMPTLGPMIDWGEKRNALPEALDSASEWFFDRFDIGSILLRTILPPVIFVFVASPVAIVVWAIFLPLLELIKHLSK